MPAEVVEGNSLEDIRQEWATKLNCAPDILELVVIEKPGIINRRWKVSVSWPEEEASEQQSFGEKKAFEINSEDSQNDEETNKGSERLDEPTLVSQASDGSYSIVPGSGVCRIVPYPEAGCLTLNGKEMTGSFSIISGEKLKFMPGIVSGYRTWELETRQKGLSVVAKVKSAKSKKMILPEEIPSCFLLDFRHCGQWEIVQDTGDEEYWPVSRLASDIQKLKIVHGQKEDAWTKILEVDGEAEVIIAEATLPVAPEQPSLEECIAQKSDLPEESERIDYFASKVLLVEEGTVLARKIPGKPGVPGKDVFGRAIPVPPMKDIHLRPKKNVILSEDGLALIAGCSGQPVRVDKGSYLVEKVYTLNRDVDLESGSIEFPGDVYVNGNVQDGLHIFAGGLVEIHGAVSHAEIRAEKGMKIERTVHGGKISVGYKYVTHSEILHLLRKLKTNLNDALNDTEKLLTSPGAGTLKPGQCLKLILERRYQELPKDAAKTEQFVQTHVDEIVTKELVAALGIVKRYITGLGPLDEQSVPYLLQALKTIEVSIESMIWDTPVNIQCFVSYVQGTTIESSGSFHCPKGAYNSHIKADGDVLIEGVCRGGKIVAGGNVTIRELGGSIASNTFVQLFAPHRLKVQFCHPNVVVVFNKEVIKIEQAYKNLEIYSENGIVQVDRLLANPL